MPRFPVKIAVASKEGLVISEYFGLAKQFRIYEVTLESCKLLEILEVSNYCLGHHGDQSAMVGILEAIKDCRALFIAKIRAGPTKNVRSSG